MSYNEKLCDERHTEISKRMDRIEKISWGILAAVIASGIIGTIREPESAKAIALKILSLVTG